MVDDDEVPTIIFERASVALVKEGFFPSDPTQPFMLNVVCQGTIQAYSSTHLHRRHTHDVLKEPLVYCLDTSKVYVIVVRDVSWCRVQGGVEVPPAAITCVV